MLDPTSSIAIFLRAPLPGLLSRRWWSSSDSAMTRSNVVVRLSDLSRLLQIIGVVRKTRPIKDGRNYPLWRYMRPSPRETTRDT